MAHSAVREYVDLIERLTELMGRRRAFTSAKLVRANVLGTDECVIYLGRLVTVPHYL